MRITIHRGTDQIGGCVTEYEDDGWRLFVDYGEQLPGASKANEPLIIEGLNHGDISKSALLITHYHGDHVGKIGELPTELPIFMGKTAKEIALASAQHRSGVSEELRKLAQRLDSVETFTPGHMLTFGSFNILPIVIDHSAFDAYAFRIESRGLSVFHTGDFRLHGFRSPKLPAIIEKYVGRVNYVVCEATNVGRATAASVSERDLQRQFQHAFEANKYSVVYVSSTNIDRLFALYHAALKAHRPFFVDSFQREIMDIVAGRDTVWGKSKLFRYIKGFEPIILQNRVNDKFIAALKNHGYVIVARQGDKFDNLLAKIPSDGRKTYLSMWDGYVDKTKYAYNADLAKSLSGGYEYMHTSGHCDMHGIEAVFEMLRPYAVIPIHTENPRGFAELFCDKWPVILLNDGESFSAIKDPGYDNIVATVLAYKEFDGKVEVVENHGNQPFYTLDSKVLGEFECEEDALSALHQAIYAPTRLLGYTIEEVEDMEPWVYTVYNPDFSIRSTFNCDLNAPLAESDDRKCSFAAGDKVMCILNYPYNAIIPAIVVEPLNMEHVKQWYTEAKEECLTNAETFEDFCESLSSWDYDNIVVRPLVRLKTKYEEMAETITIERIYLFPYPLF